MRLFLTGLAVLTMAVSADAAVRTTGDATQPGVKPYSDLTSLSVRNGAHRVVADLGIRDLRANRTSAFLIITSRTRPRTTYSVGTQSNGHRHRPVFGIAGGKTHCHGVSVALNRDSVHVSVPVRCLVGVTPTIRAFGLTEPPADGADQDRTHTLIVPRG